MTTKEVFQDNTATAGNFAEAICALVREHLVGFVTKGGEGEFCFSIPGGVKNFHVCVTEEKASENAEKRA